MPRSCCVKGCGRRKIAGAQLFSVPMGIKSAARRRIWLELLEIPEEKHNKKMEVCEKHFCKEDFNFGFLYSVNRDLRLKDRAIPHLHLSGGHHFRCTYEDDLATQYNPTIQNPNLNLDLEGNPNATSLISLTACEIVTDANLDVVSKVEPQISFDVPTPNLSQTSERDFDSNSFLLNEIKLLRQQNLNLISENNLLKSRVEQLEEENKKLKEHQAKFLNEDQVAAMKHGSMRGRRWSNETLTKACKIRLACGGVGYDLLREFNYPLPAQRTLRLRMEHLKFSPGILHEVFNALKPKIELMIEEEKHCALLLDEMAISPRYDFDPSTGIVIGKPTLPSSDNNYEELASHGLVYMLSGATSRWKQVVGYQLTGKSFDANMVVNDIKNIIHEGEKLGLKVDVVISDMAGQNQAVWRQLGIRAGRYSPVRGATQHPCDPQRKLYVSPDPPHIFKNLRDHLTNGSVIKIPNEIVAIHQLHSDEVSIKYIEMLLNKEREMELKMAPYLKESCIKPSHFEKMKVSLAVRLLHHDTGAAIRYCVERNLMPKEALTTAWFCETMFQWFKLITSRTRSLALSENIPDKYDQATKFLQDQISLFHKIKIGTSNRYAWKPVQTGVILATTNALNLAEYYIKNKGFHYVCLGHFTQDAIENLFSQIRFVNPVPSPKYFKMALRLISVAQYFKTNRRGNYEIDDSTYLAEFFSVTQRAHLEEEQPEDSLDELILDFVVQSRVSASEEQSLYYLAGSLLAKIIKRYTLNCPICLAFVKTEQEDPSIQELKRLTELKAFGKLIFASRQVYDLLEEAEVYFRRYESILLQSATKLSLITNSFLNQNNSCFPPCHQIKKTILQLFFKCRIHFLLRRVNEKEEKNQEQHLRCESRSLSMRRAANNVR